jgi:hypothetical protein
LVLIEQKEKRETAANLYVLLPTFISSNSGTKDGIVNTRSIDVTIVTTAFGSKPGDEKWNETADVDMNRMMKVIDVSIVVKYYGKTMVRLSSLRKLACLDDRAG